MKTYIKILFGASLIGSVLAFIFYRDINKEVQAITKKEEIIYLFQVGVFKNLDNANNILKKYNNAIIYQDREYYRVIIGVAYHEETKIKLEIYFTNQGIDYYLKKKRVSKQLIQELDNYENIIVKSGKSEVIDKINYSMLQTFLTYL